MLGVAPSDAVRHAYVHVPFCPQICPFCSFHVLRRTAGAVDAYLGQLGDEAARTADRLDVDLDTTYLGGGTPSMLRMGEMEQLLGSLRRRFGSLGDEVTLEIHPSTATPERMAAWLDLGVTRLSVGVESTDDAVLARLGRTHSAADGLAAAEAAIAAASSRRGAVVSVDLMCAIEGQDVEAELARVVGLGVDHVSCYTLTIEPGTPFERDGVEVDPDVAADAFDAAGTVLGAAGIERYEVSNHARPGAECRHNLGYWHSDWWLGLGPSAAAHLPPGHPPVHPLPHPKSGSNRTLSVASQPDFGSGAVAGVRAVNPHLGEWLDGAPPDVEALDGPAWVRDALVAGLRPVEGVDLEALSARSGTDVANDYAEPIARLADDGLVTLDADAGGIRLAATPAGLRVLDRVTATLLSAAPAGVA